MQEIYDKLKIEFEFITGYIYKGLVSTLGAMFASRLSEFSDKLETIKKNAFISTADKDYLYLHGTEALPPYPAETATGLVVFYGSNGAVIPSGTELKNDTATFKTLSDSTISLLTLTGMVTVSGTIATLSIANQLTNTTGNVNGVTKQLAIINSSTIQFEAGVLITGNSVTIEVYRAIGSVMALNSGVSGNISLNGALQLKQTIAGINTDLGVLGISGGKDDEAVEDYRQRVLHFQSNPQAPFGKPNIIENIKSKMPTIKFVWVKGGEYIEGKVLLIGINKSYSLSVNEQQQMLANTIAIKPAQMRDTAISVAVPTITGVNIVIQDLLPASDGIQLEIIKNIQFFFDGDMYEKDVTQSNLEAIIYKTTNGAEQVASFILVSGWKVSTLNTFWKLNNVIFQ